MFGGLLNILPDKVLYHGGQTVWIKKIQTRSVTDEHKRKKKSMKKTVG